MLNNPSLFLRHNSDTGEETDVTHAQTLAEDVTEAKKVSEAKIKRQIAELFDEEFYLQNNADVAANKIDPLEHYLHYGWREGRDPSASFSTHDYLELYPELAGGISVL